MALLGVFTIAILYRILSITDIGYYVFFMTIIGLVDTLKSGFLTNGFIKFYAGTDLKRGNEVMGSTWAVALCISVLILSINIISLQFSSGIHNNAIVLFNQVFAINTITTLPITQAVLLAQADRKFNRLTLLKLINQGLFIGSIVLIYFLKKSTLVNIVYLMILTNSLTSILVLVLGWSRLRTLQFTTSKSFMEIFHFGKYSVGTSLSANLFKVTDTFFINFFLGPSSLAMYNLGGRLIQIVEVPIASFIASIGPALSSFYNKGLDMEMASLLKKSIGILTIFILIMAIVSILFAVPIISLFGGGKYTYTEAPNLFRLFILISILYPTDRFFALTLDVLHQPQINFIKILFMLLVNLVADYIGVAVLHSVHAVVIANIFPAISSILISYFFLKKHLPFTIWSIYVQGLLEFRNVFQKIWKSVFLRN